MNTCTQCVGTAAGTCQDQCATPFTPVGANIFADRCSGETKRALPYVEGNAPATDYNVVAVKVIPSTRQPCEPAKQPCQERKCCKVERRTVCYECGPRRTDCYPADPKCYGSPQYVTAFEAIDYHPTNETHDWTAFKLAGSEFVADDGTVEIKRDKGLLITARRFSKTYEPKHDDCDGKKKKKKANPLGFLDHWKNVTILNSDLTLPDCGELYAVACMSAKTFNTHNHPFGDHVLNPDSDLRLAYGGFKIIDIESGLIVGFAFTNDTIYAYYEILGCKFDEDCDDNELSSQAFAFAIPVWRRNAQAPLSDFVRAGIALDKRKGAKYYINDVLVYNIPNLGYPEKVEHALYQTKGSPKPIGNIRCVNIAFGLFTLLDAVRPNNHGDLVGAGTGLVRLTNSTYVHPIVHDGCVEFVEHGSRSAKLFGQGAGIIVKELKVENRC